MSHHDHDHCQCQHHHQDQQSNLSFQEKMIKLLEHWVKHNRDHAKTYTDWAAKARAEEMGAVAAVLDEAAAMNQAINAKFDEARKLIS